MSELKKKSLVNLVSLNEEELSGVSGGEFTMASNLKCKKCQQVLSEQDIEFRDGVKYHIGCGGEVTGVLLPVGVLPID